MIPLTALRSTSVPASTPADSAARQDAFEPSEAVRNYRVALVNMPFASALGPSMQIGLLKAIVRRAGFPVDDYYFNVALAAQLGMRVYRDISDRSELGEMYFSIAAFGEESISMDALAAAAREHFGDHDATRLKERCERTLPAFIEECLGRIERGGYNAVAFTSCFFQQVASLALARRIKEKHPEIVIIFGGSNVEAEMGAEYVRAFSYIDYAVSGEGDAVFPALLTRLAEGRCVDDLVGLISRHRDTIRYLGIAELVRDLDSLPTPDYDSYFEAIREHGIADDPELVQSAGEWAGIPVQGSRGCWWGEKSHCTFCAINAAGMEYRSKSPERFLAEIEELSERYDRTSFVASDPIMNMKYLDGVFGRIAAAEDGYEFNFFYVKSNLTREQLKLMARGGIRGIVPGIEGLNTHVLKLMRKGVTKLQNVNLLRWANYYGIVVGYFLLHGFPGEQPEDYADERETMRLIRHLSPPDSCVRIVLERFSPNFDNEELFPTTWRRPHSIYGIVFPPHVNLEEAAFYFNYEAANVLPEATHDEANDILREWKADWNGAAGARPSLTYQRSESDLLITDTRFSRDRPRSYTLRDSDADIYEAFSSAPRTPAQVRVACPGLELDEMSVRCACDDLCDAGLMIGEAGKYLSLAIPSDPEG